MQRTEHHERYERDQRQHNDILDAISASKRENKEKIYISRPLSIKSDRMQLVGLLERCAANGVPNAALLRHRWHTMEIVVWLVVVVDAQIPLARQGLQRRVHGLRFAAIADGLMQANGDDIFGIEENGRGHIDGIMPDQMADQHFGHQIHGLGALVAVALAIEAPHDRGEYEQNADGGDFGGDVEEIVQRMIERDEDEAAAGHAKERGNHQCRQLRFPTSKGMGQLSVIKSG